MSDLMNELNSSQRVLAALKDARTNLEAVERDRNERVAIVGMAGRFPGAQTVDEFWQNLCEGVSGIQFLSEEELRHAGVNEQELTNPNYVNACSSFDGIDTFDAEFFGYSPREAEVIDPQHRVFLECAWEALEQAGYDPNRYEGAIGVYAGAALNSYLLNIYSDPTLRQAIDQVQVVVSNVMGLMPTRVSYKLNLKGPSCGIQTGCSTSLVAVHVACQSLLHHECDMALAGGVSINSSGKSGYLYQEDGVRSPDGYCRAFDARAQGTVFGNGVGIVVLKRLSDALANGDHIYAVIQGSAINNDGAQKVGLTAPSVAGQAQVIATALERAKVAPETIQYIETHGTGTALGDPIEIAALTRVFQATNGQKTCAIGSVKTNIGHLDAAAGIAGLIKTALVIKHGKIPPSLHFQTPNPQIDFEQTPFYVNTQLSEWQTKGTPRRAGVSSFGMGGTNAHVILEAAPVTVVQSPSRSQQLILLSAKTETALETMTTNLATYLRQHPHLNLADVAYTLQVGRQAFNHRRMLVCQALDDAIPALEQSAQLLSSQTQESGQRTLTFMFSGQGNQYVNMGRELYNSEPIFRSEVDRCCEFLKPNLGLDLRDLIYPDKEQKVRSISSPHLPPSLTQTAYTQPALFTIEYALAQLWISWGIAPDAMIGHSIGEYVAATLAGVFSLEDALSLVAQRSKMMQHCEAGAMLSVSLSETEVQSWLGAALELAVINAANSCVISGTIAAVDQLEQRLIAKEIPCRRLHTSHAFHSFMMGPIVEAFGNHISQIRRNAPKIPFISNVTGTWITAEQATDPAYWGQHLRQTVQFAKGIEQILHKPNPILLEVGPGRSLSTLAMRAKRDNSVQIFTSLRHPQELQSDTALMLKTLGQLWLSGIDINWTGFYAYEQRQRLPLPTYPFERQRYWIDLHPFEHTSPQSVSSKREKKADITEWFYQPSWQRLALSGQPPIQDHQCWLIFADESGLSSQIAQRLQSVNQTVITVQIGQHFTQVDDHTYAINSHNRQDYEALLQSLNNEKQIPQQIIHAWGFTTEVSSPSSPNHEGFYSLIYLTQAFAQQHRPVQLTIIANYLHDVTGGEYLDPTKATILGIFKVIPQEYPAILCRAIDLVLPETDLALERSLDQLIKELLSPPINAVVAYRAGHRWVQTYEFISLPQTTPNQTLLRQHGVYLIVGDLVSGLGMVFAQMLAEKYHARLILIGRTGLPEKSNWQKWLATHGQQDSVSQLIRNLQGLDAIGTSFLFFSADIANETQMQTIIQQACDRFGSINGIIHADVMGDRASCLISALDRTEVDRQFHSKMLGLLTLEKVLQQQSPDFYLLQSSLSAIVGGVGFAAYAAANAFMDAFAHDRRRSSSIPWISVNWDACQIDPVLSTGTGSVLLDLAMTPQEVWQATEQILTDVGIAQIAVSPTNLQTRIEEWVKPKSLESSNPLISAFPGNSASNYARPNLSTPYVAPRNPIEQTIAQAMQELLGIEQVGIHDNFFELGGHSLLAIQAITRLRDQFQVELPMREFLFESPTVAGIAQMVEKHQAEENEAIVELLEQVERMEIEEVRVRLEDGGWEMGDG